MTNEEAIQTIKSISQWEYWQNDTLEAFILAIKALEERPQGEWYLDIDNKWHCSCCKDCIEDCGAKEWITSINSYCKYCGAKMKGGAE